MNKTHSQKIAFTGIVSALCIVILFLTGVIPVATLALPAIAGCLLIAVVVEVGVRWAFGAYAVCAVLSFLLVPDREATLFYVLFFGYYPVLYAVLGRIGNKMLRWVAKFAVFNLAMLAEFYVSIQIFKIPVEEIPFLGPYTLAVMLVLMNLVFLIYDKAMDGLIMRYINVIQPKIRKMFRFR